MLLSGLHWGDEIRSPDELTPKETELTDDKGEGALALMKTMTVDSITDLDVSDRYTEALLEVIEERQARTEAKDGGEEGPGQ
ncbi:hypothetical protein ABT034_32075 [Streptomyces sp. NPDC002773]|uniref:hypothetical protein n=1 Tax=Streptomyces sp. NPDC002773 TaxID=3154430 RepID=UPI0033188119